MGDVRLNLARKWRAKGFGQIIGQDLTVRILKNSLYVGNYFPVYLLWGQRGSGKTSTARVFAAAINCEQLAHFRSNPKEHAVPCLQCASCRAMLAGKHPDFIEIDAASHTGVDHVRQIIDAASLMPLLGHKKIYLIDEAHMLSKAAFNAFLKILEEPPASVLFMLATTDQEKIIETVRSRCFQLFFKPVISTQLVDHLATICKAEEIEFESDALQMIAKESSGSVRDAINLLEQVRFSAAAVTKAAVVTSLGYIDDERLLKLFQIILYDGTVKLLPFLQEINVRLFSAEHLWTRLISLIRASIWLKNDVEPSEYHDRLDQLKLVIQQTSLKKLTKLLERFYTQEPFFIKTTDKHLFLEILLLQACQCNKNTSNSNTTPAPLLSPPLAPDESEDGGVEYIEEEDEIEEDEDDDVVEDTKKQEVQPIANSTDKWGEVVRQVERLEDPLLSSIFKQGIFSNFDTATCQVTVVFSKEFIFFNEWLNNTRKQWHPILISVFGQSAVFNPLYTGEVREIKRSSQSQSATPVVTSHENDGTKVTQVSKKTYSPEERKVASKVPFSYANKPKQSSRQSCKVFDVSDVQHWEKANLLLQYFPGVVSEAL